MYNVIKEISQNTVNNTSAVKIHYGQVTSANPLRIKIDNKFELGDTFLILTNDVKKHTVTGKITLKTVPLTDSGGDTLTIQDESVTLEIDNSLKVGEQVVLIKSHDGRKYVVIARI